jgi:asparagine synthase (glutamine-hydrolysing)
MCGIAGFIHNNCRAYNAPLQCVSMLSTIEHRGPDDHGVWMDENLGVVLGHRRLAILDLSPAGHQPMISADGRFVIVFNGEIYNHLDLRTSMALDGSEPQGGWRGHSDTETLLAGFSSWGIEATLKSAVGMFAIAVWDRLKKEFTLARDRIGEKPLYYGWHGECFLFASELKAIKVHPAFTKNIDWVAASSFLRSGYIPAPASIFQGIYKLLPGTCLRLTEDDLARRRLPDPVPFWSLSQIATAALEQPFSGSFGEAVEQLESLIRQAVQLQSVADVPVGAFLSGGIDSSTVVAMMQKATSSKVTTFSIGMPDARMDESAHAAAVAKHLGTRHVAHVIRPEEALSLIPRLPDIWDEPFADSSQIPTYLVSKLAREQVTVALSGDGGDEFFLGYPQYELYQQIWKRRALGCLPWNAGLAMLQPLARMAKINTALSRARSIVKAWRQPDPQALHRYWMDRYRGGGIPMLEQGQVNQVRVPILADAANTAGLWDANTYLADDILVKVDRAAMANSLETRAPLLDHRIIEFAYRLPLDFKLSGGTGKRVLREVLYRHVPAAIVDRPKMGFSIPLAGWLRNELRPWAEHLLAQLGEDSSPFIRRDIDLMWREHLSGQKNHSEKMWSVLTLLAFDAK